MALLIRRAASLLLLLSLVVSVLLAAAPPARAQETGPGEGTDLAIGTIGTGPGQFLELRDIAFSPAGVLYALDGVRVDNKTRQPDGNLRVQKFDRAGKLLGAIDLRDEATGQALGANNDPQRVAADSAGNVIVTQPKAKAAHLFDPTGKLAGVIARPGAVKAVGLYVEPGSKREWFALLDGPNGLPKGASPRSVPTSDRVVLVSPADGKIGRVITLAKPVANAQDLAADRAGNVYVAADPNAIYQFGPDGALLKTFGGNVTTRNEDGSELLHTVAVDGKGNVYSMTWGNPGQVTRFAADGQSLTQRGGQWKWADPWSVHSSYVAFAIDPADDRLWVAVTNRHDPAGVNFKRYHASPAIVRTKADFFDAGGERRTTPTRLPGFKPAVVCGLADNVSYEPGRPVSMTYAVAAANRSVDAVAVTWRAFDAAKNEVGAGKFDLPLTNGEAAQRAFEFTPPKFGAYLVVAQAMSAKGDMGGVGEHVAVTPRYPELGELPADKAKGGWNDAARQLWCGLPNLRIHPAKDEKGLEKTDQEIAQAERYKLTFIVQLVDNMKNLTPEHVRRVVTRYKGRVPFYEICNEPNFSSKPDEYFAGHKMAHALIKEIDPAARVMGPATVNLNLEWLGRLYDLGLKDVTDAISMHDYEGHESITPEHWAWKYAQARKIMAAHGDADKPIWQTERAIAGVRGNDFQGLVQAIRCTLHVDLLETLGIPAAHDYHYYLNQAGYSSVPSYVWSNNGPHPAAVALRARHALTAARGYRYAGTLDFGGTGNTFLMGVRYSGEDGGGVVAVRNLGCGAPVEHAFKVGAGIETVKVADAWGNETIRKINGGRVVLRLEQLPTYFVLAPGQTVSAEKLDFGPNLAAGATWTYSAAIEKGGPAADAPAGAPHPLTNGIFETYHDADPNGGTDGKRIFTGALPLDDKGQVLPQALTATFDSPRTFDKVIVRTVRADNAFCTLLDYDLEASADGQGWQKVAEVRTPTPASEQAKTADAVAVIWTDDTNMHVTRLDRPVTAKGLRIVARRTTYGFVADDRATAWGKAIAPKLMLREVEVYGPR